MKTTNYFTLLLLIITTVTFSQSQDTTEDPIGLRIKRNGKDYIVYGDNNGQIDTNVIRKINYRVYFRIIDLPVIKHGTDNYQLITIPGNPKEYNQEQKKLIASGIDINNGRLISDYDEDKNFWIKEDVVKNNTNTEYYKYSNDIFAGALTAPFKYRLKTGNAEESFIDGGFNVAPFIGMKMRISKNKAYYIAPFAFTGFTTINYDSNNNSALIDTNDAETGSGITYGIGVNFRFGDISPGIILGYDKGLGNLGKSFNYNNKAWISFSVNYDFVKPKQNEDPNN